MNSMTWRVCTVVAMCAFMIGLCGARAEDAKPTDLGKAEDFKGKTFTVKAKGETAFILTFPAGSKAQVTVKSKENTDINLFVYDADKKQVAKDDSPGPDCDLSFTPKEAGKFTLVIRNLGTMDNESTVKVLFPK